MDPPRGSPRAARARYLAPDDPHLPLLRHEPLAALVAQREGLADIERIVSGAIARLQPGGWLMLEHGYSRQSKCANTSCLPASARSPPALTCRATPVSAPAAAPSWAIDAPQQQPKAST